MSIKGYVLSIKEKNGKYIQTHTDHQKNIINEPIVIQRANKDMAGIVPMELY